MTTETSSRGGRKGLSTAAWVAIGCAGLVIVMILGMVGVVGFGLFKAREVVREIRENPAKVTAESLVRLNPELDLIESDDEAGTITFRNNKTGEVATVKYDEVAEGKLSISSDEGEFRVDATGAAEGRGVTISGPEGEARLGASASLEGVPEWVPVYPRASETQTSYTTLTSDGKTGLLSAKTADDSETVLEYYRKWLEDRNYEIKGQSSATTAEGSFSNLGAELADAGRSVNIGVVEQGGVTRITINYTGPPE